MESLIESLPDELLLYIFNLASWDDNQKRSKDTLLTMAQVNRKFRRIANDFTLWRDCGVILQYDSDCYSYAPRWIILGKIKYTWIQDGWGESYNKIFTLRKKWKYQIGQNCGTFKKDDRVVKRSFMKKYFKAIVNSDYNTEITKVLSNESCNIASDDCDHYTMSEESLKCDCGDYILLDEAERRCHDMIRLCE